MAKMFAQLLAAMSDDLSVVEDACEVQDDQNGTALEIPLSPKP